MPAMLDRLRSQFTAAQERYRSLEAVFTEADREPNDVERGEMDSLRTQMTELQPRIIEAVELERSLAAGSEALASIPAGRPAPRSPQQPTTPSGLDRFRS